MKQLRPFLIFFILFTVIAATLLSRISEKHKRIIECDPFAVTTINYDDGENQVILQRISPEADWMVQSDQEQIAAQPEVAEMATKIFCVMPYNAVFSREMIQGDTPQLTDPLTSTMRVTVTAEQSTILHIGGPTPEGTEVYVWTGDNPQRVYTMANGLLSHFRPSFLSLRSRYPLTWTSAGELAVTFEDRTFRLQYDQGWQTADPTLHEEEVETLSNAFSTFYYSLFHEALTAEEKFAMGIFSPDVTFRWEPRRGPASEYALYSANGRYFLSYLVHQVEFLLILEPESPAQLMEMLRSLASTLRTD